MMSMAEKIRGIRWLPWAAVAAVAVAMVLLPADTAEAAKKKRPAVASFFNSKEVRSSKLAPFKKWTSAIERYSKEMAKQKGTDCNSKKFNECHYAEWTKFLDGLRDKDKMTQVVEVNKYMNTRKYIEDPDNWGKKDYWATPGEFLARFGDCEDYAISKFLSLERLGFEDKEMRVVAVKDMNLKIGHAVLVVFMDGKVHLLDNQIKQVVDTTTVKHYQPVFSINKTYWWRHLI